MDFTWGKTVFYMAFRKNGYHENSEKRKEKDVFCRKNSGRNLDSRPGLLAPDSGSTYNGTQKGVAQVEKFNTETKTKQIKEAIVEDILSGVFLPGESIPSQSDYAKQYGVSRLTVRKAIDDLVAKGILWTEQGKGTFVQELAVNAHSYRRVSGFSSNVGSGKVHTHSKVISIQELPADVRLSRHLQIPQEAPVVLIERLRYINQVCSCFQRSFLVKERVAQIDFEQEHLEANSLYAVLREKAGITLNYVDEQFRAIRASRQLAEYFAVGEGDPVLYVRRVTYDGDNRPIEYCEDYESSDVKGAWVKSISF